MSSILIRNGRIIDPTQELDRIGSILVADGIIHSLNADPNTIADTVVDAQDRIVAPGLIDIGTELRRNPHRLPAVEV